MEKYWIAMIKTNDEYFVLAGENRSVNNFGSKERALDFFREAYARTSVNTAIYSAMTTQPRVVETDMKTLETKLFDPKKGVHFVRLGGNMGYLHGLKCNRQQNLVKKVYESGLIPG